MAESLVDLLDQLSPFAEPPPVSMFPATPAWAVLAVLLLAAAALALWAWLRYRRATAWRREALAELRALGPGLQASDPAALAALQILLRRVALASAPRPEVASLTGDGWTHFLADAGARFGDLAPDFAGDLALAPYRPVAAYDGTAALAAARAWIRRRHA